MARQYLCAALHSNISGASNVKDRVQTGLENACNELNNYSSDHSYEPWGPKDHNWSPDAYRTDDVDTYIDNFAYKLEQGYQDGDISVVAGDVWIIIDAFDEFGYGDGGMKREIDMDNDGTDESTLHLGRAISCEKTWSISDPNDMTKKLVKHNIGHCFNQRHRSGRYSVKFNDDIKDITPLANSYVRGAENNQGTEYKGTGSVPSDFDVDDNDDSTLPNQSDLDKYFCGNNWEDWCRHEVEFNDGTLIGIDRNTPRPG